MSEEDSNLPFDPAASEAFNRHSERCLDGKITHKGDHPVACGGYADIYQGEVVDRGLVAVKVMRPWSSAGKPIQRAKLAKRLWREYLAWSSLSHPNIIELLGFSYEFSPEWFLFPSLISPWMSNGTVDSYIEDNHLVDRLHLLVGIAKGLCYLHTREPPIIHGDLRAGNVLVSDSGDPYLCDFGLSRVLGEARTATSSDPAGSLRWMSPELLHGDSDVNQYSDIWAYGMTVLEVFTRDRPYSTLRNDGYVISRIVDGLTPSRPRGVPSITSALNDEIWSICCQCWIFEPTKRLLMKEIISKLSEISVVCHVKSPSESLHTCSGTPSRRNSIRTSINSLDDGNFGIALAQQDEGADTKQSSLKLGSLQKSGKGEDPPRGTLGDLANLVGVPQLENSVRTLMRCYDALEDVKARKSLCRQLHNGCVALLLDIKDIPAGISNQRAVDRAETLITSVSTIVQELSGLGRIKSISYRYKINKALKKLHEEVSLQRRDLLVTRTQTPRRFPIHMTRFPWFPSRTISTSQRDEALQEESTGPLLSFDVDYSNPPKLYDPSDPSIESSGFHRDDANWSLNGPITDFNSQSPEIGGYANERKVVRKSIGPFWRAVSSSVEKRILLRLWRKYEACHSASHPNVLSCLGFTYEFSPESSVYPSLIMPCLSNGTLSSYLDNHPEVDIPNLLLGVAKGLSYLHDMEPPIVYGDVRAENIFVSDSGVPCLNGLRLSEVFRGELGNAPEVFGSLRWMSWELLSYNVEPDWRSDVWAYGMTILEITSRNPPYQELNGVAAVLHAIRGKTLPSRPNSAALTDDLWEICLKCWNFDPSHRPTMNDLLLKLDGDIASPAESPL